MFQNCKPIFHEINPAMQQLFCLPCFKIEKKSFCIKKILTTGCAVFSFIPLQNLKMFQHHADLQTSLSDPGTLEQRQSRDVVSQNEVRVCLQRLQSCSARLQRSEKYARYKTHQQLTSLTNAGRPRLCKKQAVLQSKRLTFTLLGAMLSIPDLVQARQLRNWSTVTTSV